MNRKSMIYVVALTFLLGGLTACEDMLDVSSSSIQYEDRHELNSAADSLYSVIGILGKLQNIADRTVLLGELRGDLVTDNENTDKDLRELINHDVKPTNAYLNYSDYYAVINNCNYFLEKVDTNVIVSGQKVMLKEVAVVKGIRAWTYMQLALIYQSVPFITKPILSLQSAEELEKQCEYKNLEEICDYFILDLLPFVDTKLPNYGTINDYDSQRFFFPIRLLLGDMYLWKGMYMDAFNHYAAYISDRGLKTELCGVKASNFTSAANDITSFVSYNPSNEYITIIRMSSSKLYGTISNLENVFSPTELNEGRRAVSPSRSWKELSEKQVYAYQGSATDKMRYLTCGDLRAVATYYSEWNDGTFQPDRVTSSGAWYQVDVDNKYLINSKYGSSPRLGVKNSIAVYRASSIFLRMAEAINRLGYPELAFSILKNGVEQMRPVLDGGYTWTIPTNDFNDGNVVGIHSRGSGNSAANERYNMDATTFDFGVLPDPNRTYLDENSELLLGQDFPEGKRDLMVFRSYTYYGNAGMPDPNFANGQYDGMFTLVDSIRITGLRHDYTVDYTIPNTDTIRYRYIPTAYLVDKVEQMIVDEMALETAFEGQRYYDLMRVAMRREDPAFLADKVARREGEEAGRDEALYDKLNDSSYNSWFLHKE